MTPAPFKGNLDFTDKNCKISYTTPYVSMNEKTGSQSYEPVF